VNASFEKLWEISTRRLGSKVQERRELLTLFGLAWALECESYLEIGASLGGSVIVIASAIGKKIVVVDLYEPHSSRQLESALARVRADGKIATGIAGDSTSLETVAKVEKEGPFDLVLIDGGHSYDTVRSDWLYYGPMARKAVAFHDIAQPGVARMWREIGGGLEIKSESTTMGFGIIFR
jgi:predicted O-methyltransferase YrrM